MAHPAGRTSPNRKTVRRGLDRRQQALQAAGTCGDRFIEPGHVHSGDRNHRRSSGRHDVVRHGSIGHGSHKRRSRRHVCDGHWDARSERRFGCHSAGLRRRKRRRSAHRRSEWSRPVRRWHRTRWDRSRSSCSWFPVRRRHAGISRSEFRWIVNRIAWARHARCNWSRFHRPPRAAQGRQSSAALFLERQEQTRRPRNVS